MNIIKNLIILHLRNFIYLVSSKFQHEKIAFIIILSTISIIKAQTNRFFYEVKFKEDSTQTEHQKVFMVLDINPDETKYYDNTFLEKDSINKTNHSQLTNWTSQIPVTRKKSSNKNINYTFIGDQLYSYPTEDLIQWKLSDKTKKYLHFDLQEATTNFGGRKWTAWFTKEIPLSEGPYKFYRIARSYRVVERRPQSI
ncbi:GLPGLI family protein [Chryseobacterium indoltheticum]|uniref:GLPGLI family protein n=1 Tax=Chryseobacterium indoltheticum TaxID=254 RepID=UPI003F4989E2